MSPRSLSLLLGFAIVASSACAGGAANPAGAQADAGTTCDRRCLLQVLRAYTEALTDNDLSRLPLAPAVRVTNNGDVTKPGAGDVWGPGRRLPYRQVFVDAETGAAVFYGVVARSARPGPGGTPPPVAAPGEPESWFYVVRLKVEDRAITEIEEIAYSPGTGGFGASPQTLQLADRIFDTVLPDSERTPREELFRIADMYFDAVSHRVDYRDVPWHPECQRVELGVFTVNTPRSAGSCGGEFQIPSHKWNVENRRFYVADVERGVVLAVGNFMTPPEYPTNNGSVVMEVFKVQDGLIRHIHAFFRGNGQSRSGWGEGPGA